MASRLAQRRRPPGFIHLPPPPSAQLPVRAVHHTPKSPNPSPLSASVSIPDSQHDSPSPSTSLKEPSEGAGAAAASPQILHTTPPGPRSPALAAMDPSICSVSVAAPTTAPVAIPPPPQVSSPYYSPSQIFPPSCANKSYFPAYLAHSSQQHHQHMPKPPRSPSSFLSAPGSPILSSNEHPSSPLFGKPKNAATAPNPPAPASSTPRSYHAHLAQQQMAFQMQQRELIFQATRATTAIGPISPRLLPLGSPGPVTPLALEDGASGYLLMSSSGRLSSHPIAIPQQSHLERLPTGPVTKENPETTPLAGKDHRA